VPHMSSLLPESFGKMRERRGLSAGRQAQTTAVEISMQDQRAVSKLSPKMARISYFLNSFGKGSLHVGSEPPYPDKYLRRIMLVIHALRLC
jgi:hypothetical protein